jgi:hypothetical protein
MDGESRDQGPGVRDQPPSPRLRRATGVRGHGVCDGCRFEVGGKATGARRRRAGGGKGRGVVVDRQPH